METLVINPKASKVSGKLVSNVVNLENLRRIRDSWVGLTATRQLTDGGTINNFCMGFKEIIELLIIGRRGCTSR